MAVTMQQVRKALDPEEPDYAEAAELGPDALPHLEKLVRQNDSMLSPKAAYLAALIPHDRSADVVRLAATSSNAVVRVAAAAAASLLPGADAAAMLEPLLADHDEGVRKVALSSVQSDTHPSVRKAVEKIAGSDGQPALRNAATKALSRLAGEGRYPSAAPAPAGDSDGRGMGGGSLDGRIRDMQGDEGEPGVGRGGGSVSSGMAVFAAPASSDIVEDSAGAGSGGGMAAAQASNVSSGVGQGGGSISG